MDRAVDKIMAMIFISALILFPSLFGNKMELSPEKILEEAASSGTRMADFLDNKNYPYEFWKPSAPDKQGMDKEPLQDLVDYIDKNGLEIHSLLIAKNGRLVFESYGRSVSNNYLYNPDDTHILYSTTKSVLSALVGIAIQEKFIHSVRDKLISFFPHTIISNMSALKSNITLENLLTMTSGMTCDDDRDISALSDPAGASDPEYPAKVLLGRTMDSEPGTSWNYDSANSHLLSIVLARQTGRSTLAYCRQRLFRPLGINRYKWDNDSAGNYLGGFGLELTPRDMLKFGYLFLKNGMWEGKRIIGREWVSNSTAAHTATTWNANYGYLWWVPIDKWSYYSQGSRGQNIFVFPALDMVVVYTANLPEDTADKTLAALNRDFILPAVLNPIRFEGQPITAKK